MSTAFCDGAENMVTNGKSLRRYRARAARRPVLFWWQAFLLLGVVVLLWAQLPMSAVLYETRVFAPLAEARCSYVLLDPAYAVQALKKMRTSWTAAGADGKNNGEMELGIVDLNDVLQPPSFLDQGAVYPGKWQPAAVSPLPQPLPDIRIPSVADAAAVVRLPEPASGIRSSLDSSLAAARFTFQPPNGVLPDREGSCRYYVETDVDGTVVHLLLLSPWCGSASVFEQALLRGKAKGTVRGFVSLSWSLAR